MKIRVGTGFDIHRLEPGRPLRLGGVRIPHSLGLVGHSDGDALLHAMTDALLGAAGLGNIGQLFPDTDARYEDADSTGLLREVSRMVGAQGFGIGNVDSTILAEQPKLLAFLGQMAAHSAQAMGILPPQVSVKAKTMEGLGPIGREEAIAAQVVVLLYEL